MSAPNLYDPSLLVHGSHKLSSLTNNISTYRPDVAVENRIRGAERRVAAPVDPFTFYKTYLDTNIPLLGDQESFESDDDGYTCNSGAAVTHDAPVDDAQPQARGHTAAYKLAVRLANRSNGAPLATIIEQGSYSTLNSHGSLLSMGRFPSLKSAENTSPNRGSRRRSRSLEEKALHDIQEDLAREHDAVAVAVPYARLDEEYGAADPASGTATPLTSYRFEMQQSPSSQSGDESLDYDSRGVKGFIRGVLQNVRGVSRTRSRSSSMTQAPIMQYRDSPPLSGKSSPHVDQKGRSLEFTDAQKCNRNISTQLTEGAVLPSIPGGQNKNRAISSSGVERSAHAHTPLSQSRSNNFEPAAVFGSISPVLPCRAATHSHEQPFPTPTVRPGTCGRAREDGMSESSISRQDVVDNSARRTFDDMPVHRGPPSSLKEASSAREVFASQNASFCSTMSTSYSGTVLGVDLDLQHDFTHPTRRSQSPPTPVWFTPQMAELERQASFSESPDSVEATDAPHAPYRSITSSALTSLLPIAAASGIVRPNYNTPKISFFSPSGNLIQPESSSPQGSSPSDYGNSPEITTSYYNKQNSNIASSSGSLPIRPPLVPMTTPPTYKTPLPSHLRHHHNYRHPEKSQISSHESPITPKGPVKGCDGVVRENSLTPRSGVFHPHGKDRVHRSAKLVMHDLKAEAKFYTTRFIALAAAQSFAPSVPKGRTLEKRHVHNYNTYASKPHHCSSGTAEARKGGYKEDFLGPLAAHALRVCFCQPYDGAGKPTHATTAGACLAGEPFSAKGRLTVDRDAKDADRPLPNARVVDNGRCCEGQDAKRTMRKDSAVGSTTQRSSRVDTTRKRVD